MICVSIGHSRHKMMIAEHRAAAQQGAELVELRLDWLSRLPQLARLIKDRPTPVIVACRREKDGGRWRGQEDQRLALLRSAIVDGVEYIDLEGDVAKQVPRYGKTKRIVSYHHFDATPDNLDEIHAQLSACDPDIVKLVTMAKSLSDMIRVLKLVESAQVPTIGFCMGEFGLASRILCGKYGSPLTYASYQKSRELAPGQLTFADLKDLYRFDTINRETMVLGVLGDATGADAISQIHNAAFANAGLNAVCVPLCVPADGLAAALVDLQWLALRGYVVVEPYLEAALRGATRSENVVGSFGRADLLPCDERGERHATATIGDAATHSLDQGLGGDEPDPSES